MSNKANKPLLWKFVKSSNIFKYGYDLKYRDLFIVFINRKNAVYRFEKVPYTIFLGLNDAISKGDYFADKIKGRYDFIIE